MKNINFKITENARVALAASGFISLVMLFNYAAWF
jgi:hypothetical protein